MTEQLIVNHLSTLALAVQNKSASGRGSGKKIDLYGIKKLRELILELAVRGKLVAQNPGDEPASKLLERIEAEKTRLVKEKKIKKQKALPAITEDDKPFELPVGWEWTTLSHLGVFSGGKTPSKASSKYWGGDIPWVTPKDMKVSEITDSEDKVTRLAIEDGLAEFQENAVLFVVRSGILRRHFPVAISKVNCTVNQDLKVLSLIDNAIARYVQIMMMGFESYILKRLTKTGTTVESLKFEEFAKHYFLLPPEAEQHRIVAKVDELMALCDQIEQQTEASLSAHTTLVENLLATLTTSANAEELKQNWQRIAGHFTTLFTTEASIDQLKQTILQLAVMGKLVPQDPNDEPAAKLLERIATEKAQLVKEGKIKKQKPLPPISEDEKPFELPVGWEWCRLDNLTLFAEAGWSPKCDPQPREGDNWGVLKVSAVTWGTYKPEENKTLPHSLEPRPQYEVKAGDFLISRANTAELVAKAVVVPEETEKRLMMSDKIIRFQFSKTVSSHYVNLANNSVFSRSYYAEVAGGTSSSMKNVSQGQVRNLVVALPPMEEERRILVKVNQLITLCDQIKTHLQHQQQTRLHLADAMVDQALHPNNPNSFIQPKATNL